MNIFERLESEVRGYCRSFPVTFTTAQGAELRDDSGKRYLDFLAGAGTLNYGHNNPIIKKKVAEYIQDDGLLHGLDMHTQAKQNFLETFERNILWPIESDYKMQFTGPTGTNAVEAAFKLARNITGRTNIISFTNGFHGVTLGSVAATGNSHFRNATGVPLGNVSFMPYDGYFGTDVDTVEYLRKFLTDGSSGVDLPAAVVVETVQGEGGVNVASFGWLQRLEKLCREFDILMIVDDIQVGCGRTGTFFSFERAGISPDIVTLSKSLGGYGLPMSLVLMKSDLDNWKPGEHNGTFRGNNLAFVAAAEAIETYWSDGRFTREINRKGTIARDALLDIADKHEDLDLEVRGRGMIWGLVSDTHPKLASAISAAAFKHDMIIETSGAQDQVLKLLPPLVIEEEQLKRGLEIIATSIEDVLDVADDLSEFHADELEEVNK